MEERERRKREYGPDLSISSCSLAKSQAGQLRLAAQECSWNLKPLPSPLVSHRANLHSCMAPLGPPENKPPSSVFHSFHFLTLCVSGYEEVVRIPKGSVFIHIQELNISLNYLGKMGFNLVFSNSFKSVSDVLL